MTKPEFDPTKSNVSAHMQAAWLRAPITGDLTEVPGIGPFAVEKLATSEPPITTTHQLLGSYLMMKGKDTDPKEHAQQFYNELAEKGVNSFRSGVVDAVASKAAVFIPGIYDPMAYESHKAEHAKHVAEHHAHHKKHAAGEGEAAAAAAAAAPTN